MPGHCFSVGKAMNSLVQRSAVINYILKKMLVLESIIANLIQAKMMYMLVILCNRL